MEQLKSVTEGGSGGKVPGVLVATKADLRDRRTVSPKSGSDMASQLGMQYFECSSKDHEGVEEPFFYLANEWHKPLKSAMLQFIWILMV